MSAPSLTGSLSIPFQTYRNILGNNDLTDDQIVLIHTRLGQYPLGQKPSVYCSNVFSRAAQVWATLSEEIRVLDEKIAEDTKAREDLRVQKDSLCQEMEGQNLQIESLQRKIDALNGKLGEVETQLNELVPQLEAVESERKSEAEALDQSAATLERHKKEKESHEKEWGKYLYNRAESIPGVSSLFGSGSISQSTSAIGIESVKKQGHEKSLTAILIRKGSLESTQSEYLETRSAVSREQQQLINHAADTRKKWESLNKHISALDAAIASSQIDRGSKNAQREQIAIIKKITGKINLNSHNR